MGDYCQDIGRDPASIERAVLVAGDPVIVGRPLRDLGATLFVVTVHIRPHIDLSSVQDWLRWRDQENG